MTVPGEMRPAAEKLAAQFASKPAAEFVQDCREFIRDWGTLPQPLVGLRRQALRTLRAEAAGDGRLMRWIAQHLGFSPDRFSKLTSAKTAEVTS